MKINGAKCEVCSLGRLCQSKGEFIPVLGEQHSSDEIAIVGEAPGTHEELEGRPFVGPSGQELQAALGEIGLKRERCRISNVLACRPPQNRLDSFLIQHTRSNKARKKKGEDLLLLVFL